MFRNIFKIVALLALMSVPSAAFAQQNPADKKPSATPAPLAQGSPVSPAVTSGADSAAPSADAGRQIKNTPVTLRELSPWSMFLSADVLVKAVMVGLAFASLVTWTIFLAKMFELSLVQHRLRAALGKI